MPACALLQGTYPTMCRAALVKKDHQPRFHHQIEQLVYVLLYHAMTRLCGSDVTAATATSPAQAAPQPTTGQTAASSQRATEQMQKAQRASVIESEEQQSQALTSPKSILDWWHDRTEVLSAARNKGRLANPLEHEAFMDECQPGWVEGGLFRIINVLRRHSGLDWSDPRRKIENEDEDLAGRIEWTRSRIVWELGYLIEQFENEERLTRELAIAVKAEDKASIASVDARLKKAKGYARAFQRTLAKFATGRQREFARRMEERERLEEATRDPEDLEMEAELEAIMIP